MQKRKNVLVILIINSFSDVIYIYNNKLKFVLPLFKLPYP